MTTTETRPIRVIAGEIASSWKTMPEEAKVYVRAMTLLDKVTDRYYQDDAKGIVLYFLSNARGWRGEDARRIKAELKAMVK
ncbi:hypothetical protein SEA_NEDARYA_94 [Gordonia phage Nedarya]|nr:hypothetical protein SEA_NEDARYA_94 [Gordonia phage Nedarya]